MCNKHRKRYGMKNQQMQLLVCNHTTGLAISKYEVTCILSFVSAHSKWISAPATKTKHDTERALPVLSAFSFLTSSLLLNLFSFSASLFSGRRISASHVLVSALPRLTLCHRATTPPAAHSGSDGDVRILSLNAQFEGVLTNLPGPTRMCRVIQHVRAKLQNLETTAHLVITGSIGNCVTARLSITLAHDGTESLKGKKW